MSVKLELGYSYKGERKEETHEVSQINDAKPFRDLYFKLNNWPLEWQEDYKKFILEGCWDDAQYWITKLELDLIEDDFSWSYIRWK